MITYPLSSPSMSRMNVMRCNQKDYILIDNLDYPLLTKQNERTSPLSTDILTQFSRVGVMVETSSLIAYSTNFTCQFNKSMRSACYRQ